jgi:hypothetical protein
VLFFSGEDDVSPLKSQNKAAVEAELNPEWRHSYRFEICNDYRAMSRLQETTMRQTENIFSPEENTIREMKLRKKQGQAEA